MFVGREFELSLLEQKYDSDKFEFVVISAHRRVGVTALLTHFIQGKNAIYCTGVDGSLQLNLANVNNSILAYSAKARKDVKSGKDVKTGKDAKDGKSNTLPFSSIAAALEQVFAWAETERLVLVLDDYHLMSEVEHSLSSTLKELSDKYQDSSKLMVILFNMAPAHRYDIARYGLCTVMMPLQPFYFAEACRFLSSFSAEDKALAYGILGRKPRYLEQFDARLSIEENIKNTFLNPNSFLFTAPLNFIKNEFAEPEIYIDILTAIAHGVSRLKDIAVRVGQESRICYNCIRKLIYLGLVLRHTPCGQPESHRTLYLMGDNTFRFWFRFVAEHQALIEGGEGERVYQLIAADLEHYMGEAFFEICLHYLWSHSMDKDFPVFLDCLGYWWGYDAKKRKHVHFDLVGQQDESTALCGDCLWVDKQIDSDALESLLERSQSLPYSKLHYYLFAKSDFTQGCRERAQEMGNVTLVTYADILKSCGV